MAAVIGAVASIDAGAFYTGLARPGWAPPPGVFGPAWTVLYALMAIAAWSIWRDGGFSANRTALGLFLAQLAVNALWSWLFFTWHLGGWALTNILILIALLIATLRAFWPISRSAVFLLVPYLLWVGFAAVLNYAVWRLNPELL